MQLKGKELLEEAELEKRNNQIKIGIKYLKSAADIFGKTGYIKKKKKFMKN